jgi:hypothetical protein
LAAGSLKLHAGEVRIRAEPGEPLRHCAYRSPMKQETDGQPALPPKEYVGRRVAGKTGKKAGDLAALGATFSAPDEAIRLFEGAAPAENRGD